MLLKEICWIFLVTMEFCGKNFIFYFFRKSTFYKRIKNKERGYYFMQKYRKSTNSLLFIAGALTIIVSVVLVTAFFVTPVYGNACYSTVQTK